MRNKQVLILVKAYDCATLLSSWQRRLLPGLNFSGGLSAMRMLVIILDYLLLGLFLIGCQINYSN